MMPPARYVPDFALPPYSYVPGQNPHPKSSPNGHGCPGPKPCEACADFADRWMRCPTYLWGIDLFNNGFFWESHEAWEEAWISVGRKGVIADFLKGLIKLAASNVKLREGKPVGALRHATRAAELFLRVAENHNRLGGMSLRDLIHHAHSLELHTQGESELTATTNDKACPLTLVLDSFDCEG